MTNDNSKKNNIYIYDLPYTERKKLCDIIDMNEKWEELGGKYMKLDNATIHKISKAPMRNHSPTDELLGIWGEKNHTVNDLFYILQKMQHYQAMTVIKQFVDQKYHDLLNRNNSISLNTLVNSESSRNFHDVGKNIQFDSNSNQRRDSSLKHQNLLSSQMANKIIDSDLSETLSSAEAVTPLITYEELEKASNNWNEKFKLGSGGFGVVYKGMWKNTAVAIKRIEPPKGAKKQFDSLDAQREALLELQYLSSCRHDNILSLYGFSIGGEKPCLVFQYMVNGSLLDRLRCLNATQPLSWRTRFNIASGSARGLQYLHKMDKTLVHGDIKSANILLDKYFEPRIGDFGLAREGPLQEYTHVDVTHVYGTKPYLPDEFLRGKKFSTKVDTYSFGVVLFEIATGLGAQFSATKIIKEPIFLKEYILNYGAPISNLIDKKAGTDENNVFDFLISLGKSCVSYKAKDRPEMEQVFIQLESKMLQTNHQFTSGITSIREVSNEEQSTSPKELNTKLDNGNQGTSAMTSFEKRLFSQTSLTSTISESGSSEFSNYNNTFIPEFQLPNAKNMDSNNENIDSSKDENVNSSMKYLPGEILQLPMVTALQLSEE